MKKIIVLLSLCICVLAGCGADADVILQNGVSEQEMEIGEVDSEALANSEIQSDGEEASSGKANVSKSVTDEGKICVYVCGAVNAPGVYELSADSRIYQAVEMAGGLSEEADEKSVNLAETVSDGQMIQIPTVEEVQSGNEGGSSSLEEVSSDTRVNINTATVEELTGLNGIGETKAEAIIAYREAHGGFQSADEIMQVDGIGEGTYQKLQDDIRVE